MIEKPRSADDLISEADYARDDRLPYWADLWPSATVLARYIAAGAAGVGTAGVGAAGIGAATRRADEEGAHSDREVDRERPRALELGCGLGLVTIAVMRAGYAVTATDYYEDALLFTARNALRATGREPETRLVDWRSLPDDVGSFELVFAADVLYERTYAPLVAETFRRTLAPDGRGLLADQGRVALGSFLEEVTLRGLRHRVVHQQARPLAPPSPEGSSTQLITLFELRHG